jgi:hypothetical protein
MSFLPYACLRHKVLLSLVLGQLPKKSRTTKQRRTQKTYRNNPSPSNRQDAQGLRQCNPKVGRPLRIEILKIPRVRVELTIFSLGMRCCDPVQLPGHLSILHHPQPDFHRAARTPPRICWSDPKPECHEPPRATPLSAAPSEELCNTTQNNPHPCCHTTQQ